jgi:RimJ/RimL family protein N-acetyltransferase
MLKFLRFVYGRLRMAHRRELPTLLWLGLRSIFWTRLESRFYVMTAEQVSRLPNSRPCRRDCFDDLQHYERFSYYQPSKERYQKVAEERRRDGGHLYTIAGDGVLEHFGWVRERETVRVNRHIQCAVRLPPESALLWDFATHPRARGRGLYRQALRQCLHDAVELHGARQVYIYVDAGNRISRHVIESIGFEYQGSIVRERRLFKTRRHILPAAPSFDAWPVE